MTADQTFGNSAKVVVTGGAGFLGSALVESLVGIGCRVIVIDDFSGGDRGNLPQNDTRLEVMTAKVGEAAARAMILEAIEGATFVFHLASPIGVGRAHGDRFGVTRNIVDAGSMIADACRLFRCPLLYTSSSEVYGAGRAGRISEDEPLVTDIRPRWCYAVAKAAIEHLVAGLFFQFDVPVWIVRPFNMTGARQRPETGLVVPTFARAALRGQPLVVHGDGSQMRAFLHVADAVDALLLIAGCPALQGRPVNLGGSQPWRIGDLAQFICDAAETGASVLYKRPEDVYGNDFAPAHDRLPDTSLLAATTGWRPTRSMHQAVLDCMNHLRTNTPCLA